MATQSVADLIIEADEYFTAAHEVTGKRRMFLLNKGMSIVKTLRTDVDVRRAAPQVTGSSEIQQPYPETGAELNS